MKKILASLFLLVSILTSCVSYTDVQLGNVAFRDFDTKDGKMRATFDLEIDNPNAFPIRLSKPRLKVFVGNLELKDWSVSRKIKLRRKSKQSYPFYVEISAAEGLQILPRLLMQPEIKIEGTVRAGSFIFGRRIPLAISERLY
jgi:LEA14-like dessication related protein